MSKVRAEQYTNRAGSGAPEIPYGVTVPEGASIDGAGGLNLTGIATAGSFKGNLTGDVSGNVTGVAATFTGPVTIGGTLTYEDVTNIDSVGVITARDGIKVTGGDVQVGSAVTVDTSGINVTGVVTATSYRGDGSQLSGIEAAPTIQLTADGNIGIHSGVIVTSAGKAKKIEAFTAANGAENVAATDSYLNSNSVNFAYDDGTGRVMGIYRKITTDGSGNYHPMYVVGTKSGNTVTYGSSSNISTADAYIRFAICNVGTDKFCLFYEDGTNLKAVIATTTSSNTATFGTAVTVADVQNSDAMTAQTTNTGNVILAYDTATNNQIRAVLIVISGTSITVGTPLAISGGVANYGMDSVWDSIRNNMYLAYSGTVTSEKIYGISLRETGSGNNIAYGQSSAQLNSQLSIDAREFAIDFDPDTDNFYCIWKYTGNNEGYYNRTNAAYDTANHTPVWNSAAYQGLELGGSHSNTTNATGYNMHYDRSMKKFIITNKHSTDGYFSTASVASNRHLSFDSNYAQFHNGYNYYERTTPLGFGAILLPFMTSGTTIKTVIRQFDSTSLNEDNFIGFSKDAYTDGNTATINVVGNVTTKTGLTAGKKYYVRSNGDLSVFAEPTATVVAGRALSATSLLIQPA